MNLTAVRLAWRMRTSWPRSAGCAYGNSLRLFPCLNDEFEKQHREC